MPTTLPPVRVLPWPKVRRAVWLRLCVMGINARMKWLPATHAQRLVGARRWLAYSEEMFRLLDMPEPEHIGEMRAMFMRPLPNGFDISE